MIRVNDDYVILVDTLNYALCRDAHKEDKKGNPVYKSIGYYPSLELALKGIIKDMNARALEEGTHSLQEAVEIIKHSNDVFTDMLRGVLGNGGE